jgi:multiple sugar transport system permease protein
VTVFIITITLLASANMFGQSVLITQGGPGDTTTTALMVITDTGFAQFRMGQATAMSYVLALCLAVVSVVNFALLRERKS